MLTKLQDRDRIQLMLGLVLGIGFGFLLYKSGLTSYQVIVGQLLLRDFTMIKVIFTAIITGMIGNHLLQELGLVELHPGSGSLWTAGVGGLVFGVGFGLLGYCPGTAVGAVGRGAVDGLFGLAGIMLGVWLFTEVYPLLKAVGLAEKRFKQLTIPEALGIGRWPIIIIVVVILVSCLGLLEWLGI